MCIRDSDKAVAGTGVDQELDEDNESPSLKAKIYAEDFMREYRKMYRIVSGNFGKEAEEEFKKIVKAKFDALQEAGPGFKHDCAAKVIHKEYGEGNTIPEKHTLVKEGNKYIVTHYDVLFENGNTVLDIPVNELDIKTTNEHWHKGYKKKKK